MKTLKCYIDNGIELTDEQTEMYLLNKSNCQV